MLKSLNGNKKHFRLLIILIADCINFKTVFLTCLHLQGLKIFGNKIRKLGNELIDIVARTRNIGVDGATIAYGEGYCKKKLNGLW